MEEKKIIDKEELKEIVLDVVKNKGILESMKAEIKQDLIGKSVNKEIIIAKLREHGLAADILQQISVKGGERDEVGGTVKARELENIFIIVKVVDGKSFSEYYMSKTSDSFQVSLCLFGKRYETKPVPASVEPTFNESFGFEFKKKEEKDLADLSNYIKLNSPLHVVLQKIDVNGKKEILASRKIEWRALLHSASIEVIAEFNGSDFRRKGPLGIIKLHLDLRPRPLKRELISQRLVEEQIAYEKKYESEGIKGFYTYADEWWNDYKSIRPSHAKRNVKIFAETDDSETYSYRPVMSLLYPMEGNRLIESPYHAGRFVSLIPFSRKDTPGGSRVECWNSMHALLSKGSGDCEDHCILLCNLLLGFGMDAYIAIGTGTDGVHVWVITRINKSSGLKIVYFWESLTGQRFESDDPRVHRFYRTISCIFNHKSFFGNIQPDDRVPNTSFDLENESLWKSMAPEYIEVLTPWQIPLQLKNSELLPQIEEPKIEKLLREKITELRLNSLLLTTVWDDHLSYLLTPALVNYEMERLCGNTFGNEEFQSSVNNSVPEGHTFKAFPVQVQGLESEKALNTIKQSQVGYEIIQTKGDLVRFALRAKVVLYPQNVSALWIILAVRYRSTF